MNAGDPRPWRRVGAQARYGEGRRAGKEATWPEHSAYLLRGDVPRSTPIPRNSSPRCIDGPSPRTSFGQNDSDKIGCAAADRIGRYAGSPGGCGYWVIDIEPCPILTGGNVTE